MGGNRRCEPRLVVGRVLAGPKSRASVLPRRALSSNPPEMRQNIVPVDARDKLEMKAMIEAETARSGCRRGGFQRTDEMMW